MAEKDMELEEENISGSDEDDAKEKEVKAYVPPKLTAMYYDGDIPVDERKEKLLQQAKKKRLSNSIMMDIKAEYDEGPEEIWDEGSARRKIQDSNVKKRTEYEEDCFVRLSVSKKQKHEERKARLSSGVNNITHFGDFSAFTEGEGDFIEPKRKGGSADKKGKKKYKRSFKKKKRH